MTKDKKAYQRFEEEMELNGLSSLLVNSHEEAAANGRKNNIVFIPDEVSGYFEVYLTDKKGDVFGEYVCWVVSEFEEEPGLVDIAIQYILGAYGTDLGDDVEGNLKKMNPSLYFNPYSREDYPKFYN